MRRLIIVSLCLLSLAAGATVTPVADVPADSTASGTLSSACTDANINSCGANSTVAIATAGQMGAALNLPAATTLVGVLRADCSSNGTTWTQTSFYDAANGRQSSLAAASGTVLDAQIIPCAGQAYLRVRALAVTSGSVTAALRASLVPAFITTDVPTGSNTYTWIVTKATPGASKLYLDLFNASGSNKVVRVRAIYPIMYGDVAVTGAVAVRFDSYRTSAVGTGGTTAAYKSATVDVAGGSISPMSTASPALPSQVTARALPTGGATISEWLDSWQCFPEETNTAAYLCSGQSNFADSNGSIAGIQPRTLREGEGLLIKQGTVASLGNIAFKVVFTVE
jgi:hypothetical protein